MRSAEIELLLPEIFRRTVRDAGPTASLLGVMEALHRPADQVLGELDSYFDPYRTDDDFVPFLAWWVDLGRYLVEAPDRRSRHLPFPSGTGRLRELVRAASYLSQWRGTANGLIRFLETATGISGFHVTENVDSASRERPFHIVVHAPADAERYRALVDRIIELEKPAYVTHERVFAAA